MSVFTVIPAIDLKGGQCVRLRQGRADDETVYSDDPVRMAQRWAAEGARYLHVVDLDGAFQGRPAHLETIGSIVKAIDIPVEVGGGIRKDADVEALLALGVDRVILGTRACAEPDKIEALARTHGERLAVGIDARDGHVQIRGWTETTLHKAAALARKMDEAGVRTLIYTDTATDGMLSGPNIEAMDALCAAVSCRVIASGGVSSVEDMRALCSLGWKNLEGAIVGKALYDERVTLGDLLKAAETTEGRSECN